MWLLQGLSGNCVQGVIQHLLHASVFSALYICLHAPHSSHRFPSRVETPVPVTVMRVCSGLKQKKHTKPSITQSLPPSINLDDAFEVILSN